MTIDPPARSSRCAEGEYYLGRVQGSLLDERSRPLGGAPVTVCGTTCMAGETRADGSFDVVVNGCYGASSEYAHGAALSYEGLGRRTDLHFDFNPNDLTRMGVVRISRPLFVETFLGGGAAIASPRNRAPVTMVDGLGFALGFVPATITYPINASDEIVRVVRVPVDRLPPYAGRPPIAAYAISPSGAELSAPARLEFPNFTRLRPGTAVDIVAVGNHSSFGRPAVGVLDRVDVGYVSADGVRIIAANGLRFFGTVGYRTVGP